MRQVKNGALQTPVWALRARACKGIVAHNPAQTQAHMHKTKTRRLVYSPPALTQTVSGRRGVHMCMRMQVLVCKMIVLLTYFAYLHDISAGIHLN